MTDFHKPEPLHGEIIGIDPGAPEGDRTVISRPGTKFVCEVPRGIGNPTTLEVRSGKVLLRTDTGIDMIIPHNKGKDL